MTTSEDTTPPLDTTTSAESSTETSSSTTAADSTTGYVSHCEVPPDTPPVCWDRICDVFECGASPSSYDAEGCPRSQCEGAADCAAPEFCMANLLAAPCPGGQFGWWSCEDLAGDCVCGGSLGCGPSARGYCLEPPLVAEDICRATEWPCDMLPHLVGETNWATREVGPEMSPELLAQAQSCQVIRLERLLGECGMAPCELLCDVLPEYARCGWPDCSACASADPSEVIEILQALVERSLPCADCALCDELQSELCAAIAGC